MKIKSPLDNVRIVMVNTSHPGNIGAASRVMKNMGLTQLYLVEPKLFPHQDATSMAAGANDILENAQIVDKLEDALIGCHVVLGTTARSRKIRHRVVEPREAALQCARISTQAQVALVFGRERTGLTNAETDQCEVLINIPSNASFSSLNVASAVQILCYELMLRHRDMQVEHAEKSQVEENQVEKNRELLHKELDMASHEQMEHFFNHLQNTIQGIGFLDRKISPQIMPKLKNIYHRCELEKSEVNMLRGILTAMDKHVSS